ncbi:MAG: P-loop NTPase fold protein, partial [Clostridiaceae bacterium]
LETLLLRCDDYRREDSEGAYVIALDSPWGTGKTRFVKMLRNYLEDRTKEMGDESLPGKNAQFNVIYYNSWETDYANDALEPLLFTILDSQALEIEKSEEDYIELRKVAVDLVKVAGLALSKHIIGEEGTKLLEGGLKAIFKKKEDPFVEFGNRKGLYEKFRKYLGNVIDCTQKKLVIIVDELDRCRPTFAIQTLELAKHLFAVKNIAFIFALDIEQLSHSAKTLYGTGMNTSGYLCRFFDSVTKLSVPDIRTFIGELLSNLSYYKKNQSHFLVNNAEFLAQLSEIFDLSLRDITTIISAYKCMLIAFLNEYKDYLEHQAYLFFLVIKYKNIELFNEIFTGTLNKTNFEDDSVLGKRILQRRDLQSYLSALKDETIMRNGRFSLADTSWKQLLPNAQFRGPIERELKRKRTLFLQFVWEQQGEMTEFDIMGRASFRWNSLVFKNDFYRWEEMKNLTVRQYIFRQLEMFDFVLPADEAKAEP